MADLSAYIPKLLHLVRLYYNGWNDFSHTLFVQDEIDYKRAAAAYAREQLDRDSLAAMLDVGDTDGFLARLNMVANKTNLLYLGMPKKGDLAIIKQPDADPVPICRAIFELLYGIGDAAERLGVFCNFVAANNLPQRWTFPTYFLFLLYPETEIFVKPSIAKWLSKFTDSAIPYNSQPSATTYEAIREGFHALHDGLAAYGAVDMIDLQSFIYTAYRMETMGESWLKALETLQLGLPEIEKVDELHDIFVAKDEVIGRFGPLFASDHLPSLTADEFASFLDFKNNRHWTGIDQHVALVTGDMPALRGALIVLLDANRPLAEAFDAARNVQGLGKARITPFLNVAHPDLYGVWNNKSEAGLRQLDIFPALPPGESEGAQYDAVNDTLLWLAEALDIDLWTLDILWEWLVKDKLPRPLAPPFDAIFADRAQAEWAFDLFADAVERLGGGPDYQRFALTLAKNENRMRLNIDNSIVIDIADRGQVMHLTALIDEMGSTYQFQRGEPFRVTAKGISKQFAVYDIPAASIKEWPDKLQAIFKHSLEEFGQEFTNWTSSNLLRAHNREVFAALFDEEKRDHMLTNGLKNDPPQPRPPLPTSASIAREFKGFTADAFAFMSDLAANNNKAWMDANRDRWRESVQEPMRTLFTDLGPHVKRLFDPYLLPDELEITPTARKVLANINKNWTATPDSMYHEYYWGAFYRSHLSRQTDAQLFITMFSYQMRFGLFIGRSAPKPRNRFRNWVLKDPEGFFELLNELGLTTSIQHGWSFETGEREVIDVRSADDLIKWVDSGDYDLLRVITPGQAIDLGPVLVDTIFDTFRRVFPIYLLAVADEPEPLIERYLAAEFPADDDAEVDIEPPPPPYSFADFTGDTHLTDGQAAELRDMLEDKRQAIFYGPPGTGKTYVARHLGRLLTGLADPPPERLTVIQFHPAYGYEEFIEGIRPKGEKGEDGRTTIDYPVRPGAFVRFCRTAAQYGDQPCVFIIDEINRGNIPRIFGELMLLLEYRDQSIPLPYSGDRFRIPHNVHVIGTMNTADRSIALVDFALRRRFHFAHFKANPDLFDRWLGANPSPLPWLGDLYRRLTAEAIDDEAYHIGPSVFMRSGMKIADVERAWLYSVMPYLQEYYIDQQPQADRWAWDGSLLREIRGEHGG